MKHRALLVFAGVAALAFTQAPSQAEILSIKIGGGQATTANITAKLGNTQATANLGLGGSSTANATANVKTNAASAVGAQALTANANVALGKSNTATIDINGDGVIDSDDTALLQLDINGDGILNLLDDINGDGLLDETDLDVTDGNVRVGPLEIDIGDGSTVSVPPNGESLLPLVNTPDEDTTALNNNNNVVGALRRLDDNDIAALRLKCADVLASPGSFDPTTVSICRALSAL